MQTTFRTIIIDLLSALHSNEAKSRFSVLRSLDCIYDLVKICLRSWVEHIFDEAVAVDSATKSINKPQILRIEIESDISVFFSSKLESSANEREWHMNKAKTSRQDIQISSTKPPLRTNLWLQLAMLARFRRGGDLKSIWLTKCQWHAQRTNKFQCEKFPPYLMACCNKSISMDWFGIIPCPGQWDVNKRNICIIHESDRNKINSCISFTTFCVIGTNRGGGWFE